jgi:DNA-binding Lrp family transcriptional regulator
MTTALILIQAKRKYISQLGEKLLEIKGITEVYTITGKYDFVAIVRVKEPEKMAEIVTEDILKLEGIKKTETMVAFKCHSKYDLEHMFSIGLEK